MNWRLGTTEPEPQLVQLHAALQREEKALLAVQRRRDTIAAGLVEARRLVDTIRPEDMLDRERVLDLLVARAQIEVLDRTLADAEKDLKAQHQRMIDARAQYADKAQRAGEIAALLQSGHYKRERHASLRRELVQLSGKHALKAIKP